MAGAHKDSLFLYELDQTLTNSGLDNTYNGTTKTYGKYAQDAVSDAITAFTTTGKYKTYSWTTSGKLSTDIIAAFNEMRGTDTDTYAALTLWEAGEWAQAIYTISTDTNYKTEAIELANTLFDLAIGDDGLFNTTDDDYLGAYADMYALGLSGLLEGMATVGSDLSDIEALVEYLSSLGTYGDYQVAGYYALAMELAGEIALAEAAGVDIYDIYESYGLNNGYSAIYVECLGEALHGLSSNMVPEPATMAPFRTRPFGNCWH